MSEPDDPTESTPVTEPSAPVDGADEVETVSDLGPTEVEPAVVPVVAADPVHTVSRRGAGLAMAACLLVGGLLGWLVADASNDDVESRMISADQGGMYPPGYPGGQMGPGRGYPGPMGPGGGYPGGPMGPHGGWEQGPGGGWEQGPGGGEREVPPWMDDAPDDGRRGDTPDDDTDSSDQSDDTGSQGGRTGN
jgi:hypothetical protein